MRPVLLISLLITGFSLFSQTSIDSLQKVLDTHPADSASLHQLLRSGDDLPANRNAEAKLIATWVLDKAEKLQMPFLQTASLYTLGRLYLSEGNMQMATEQLGQSLILARKYDYYKQETNVYNALANIYKSHKQYDKAIEYYRLALNTSIEKKYEKGQIYALYNLGAALYEKAGREPGKKTREPVLLMRSSIEIAEKIKDTEFIMQASGVLARLYGQEGKNDSAIFYLEKGKVLILQSGRDEYLTNHYYSLGNFYLAKADYRGAIENYRKGIPYSQKFNMPVMEYRYYNMLAEAYDSLRDAGNAYAYKKKYFYLYDSITNKEKFTLITEAENKYQKAIKDAEINRLKADQALKDLELEKQKAINAGNLLEAEKKENEIRRLRTEEKIRQLEIEKQKAIIAGNMLQARQKEDEIRLLSQESALQDMQLQQQTALLARNRLQARSDSQQIQLSRQQTILKEKQLTDQKRTRNYLIGGLALLGVFSFLLYRNIIARKKAYTELQDKSQQIKDQALQLSKQAKQIAQFQSQMNPHFVYNALHNIQGLVLTDEKQKANTQIQSLAQLMRKTFANAEKDDIPLEEEVSYLQKYIDFEKTVIGNSLHFEVNVSKEAEGALVPPMMIQPFIENAIKHAELTKVQNPYIRVLIQTENNLLSIQVQDNGTGLKKDVFQQDKLSHSMSVIKSRLDLIFNGRADVNNEAVFSIQSVPDIAEGTRVKFYLPLNYAY